MGDKQYRAILIEPEARSISELSSDLTLASIHRLVGAEVLDHFRIAQFDEDLGGFDYGWVDERGLADGKPIHAFLLSSLNRDPIAGRCLIVGTDRCGQTCSARLPIPFLRAEVAWLGLILPEVVWDHTERGSRAIVTYSRVK